MDYIEVIKIITPWLSGSVAGVLLTLIVNSKIKRKNRKVLNVETTIHKYSLNFSSTKKLNIDENINVSYKSKNYSNLLLYSVRLINSGNKPIDRSNIILRFPIGTDIIESIICFSPLDIDKEYEIKESNLFIDYQLQLEKIEVNDEILLLFLVNSNKPEEFKTLIRGLDDNVILKKGLISSLNDIEYDFKQILYAYVAFIFSGTIPSFGGIALGNILQAGIFIIMIPSIIRVLNFFLNRSTKKDNKNENVLKCKECGGYVSIFDNKGSDSNPICKACADKIVRQYANIEEMKKIIKQ